MKQLSLLSFCLLICAGSLLAGSLISVSPSEAIEGGNVALTIEAENTSFTAETVLDVNVIKGEVALEAAEFSTLSDTLIEATFAIPDNAGEGLWSVEVQLSGDTLTLEDCVNVYDPDINGDGIVDISDFRLYAKHFLEIMAGYTLVPDLVSLSQSAAEQDILDAGLVLGTVGEVYSDTIDAGLVINQNPAAGELLPEAALVALTISKGPEPVIVPNLSSLIQNDAQTAIIAAGLSVGSITEQYSSTVAAGLVISQSPLAGESVAPGSAVDFVVSLGQEPAPEGGDPAAVSWEILDADWVKNTYADGSVTLSDSSSGLMWLHDASMLGTSDWSGAKTICNNLNYGGYSDWFSPNVNDLRDVYSVRSFFINVQATQYWSGSYVYGYQYVDMSTGSSSYTSNSGRIYRVWACRNQ
ncbi:MAG: PASTA domain-containing protein [Sedimentisphaeraceae bacterium JB056]